MRSAHRITASLVTAVVIATTLSLAAGTAGAAGKAEASPPKAAKVVALTQPTSVRTAGELTVFAEPARTAPSTVLPATTEFGTPTVLLADARKGAWYHVLLPTRPNGSSGWVHKAGLELRVVRRRGDGEPRGPLARVDSATARSCSRRPSPSAPTTHPRRPAAST